MGNANSTINLGNADLLDSRVIRITESVAKRLLVKNPDMSPTKSDTVSLPEPPMLRPQKHREDGIYVDDTLFKEFQKQEATNELQTRNLSYKFSEAFKEFQSKRPETGKFVVSPEQQNLAKCMMKNQDKPLNCYEEMNAFNLQSSRAL